jgi:hypothetical protein
MARRVRACQCTRCGNKARPSWERTRRGRSARSTVAPLHPGGRLLCGSTGGLAARVRPSGTGMPAEAGSQPTDRHRLVRQIRTVRGTMKFVMEVKPRFDYGRLTRQAPASSTPGTTATEQNRSARAGGDQAPPARSPPVRTVWSAPQAGAGSCQPRRMVICRWGSALIWLSVNRSVTHCFREYKRSGRSSGRSWGWLIRSR